MTLTEKQLNILNHVVEDAQAWANHGEAHFGTEKFIPMLLAKVATYESAYNEAVAKDNYQTRKQRNEAEAIAEQEQYDNVGYDVKRRREYSKLNQYEMMFDDKRDGTTTWVDKINEIKSRYPK